METTHETTIVRRRGREVGLIVHHVLDKDVEVSGTLLRICQLKDEWYQDLDDPLGLIEALSQRRAGDLFTFARRPPDTLPPLPYHQEIDNIAAIPLRTYEHWFSKQIDSKTRALVRKSQRSGIEVRHVPFNEELVRGIQQIYDETPVRQGKPFWHYKRDFDYLWRLHATYLDRADFLGAYHGSELAGFVKLVYAGRTANTMHIIAKHAHRSNAVSNALVDAAVRQSLERKCELLVYDKFDYTSAGGSASLLQFKRNNGFERVEYRRYYVPLTWRGGLAIKIGAHQGVVAMLPRSVVEKLKAVRNWWYRRSLDANPPSSAA